MPHARVSEPELCCGWATRY